MRETPFFAQLFALLSWIGGVGQVHRLAGAAVGAACPARPRARSPSETRRLLRLSASEVRDVALTLIGVADGLRGHGSHGAVLSAASARLLGLADDMQDRFAADDACRALVADQVLFGPLLQDVIATVSASIAPGSRQWLLSRDAADLAFVADRRAVSQVLQRVLCHAVRFTLEADRIDITVEREAETFRIVVADEGTGAPALAGSPGIGARECRGIGLGLTLARSLMQAHGGTLEVEAAARVGTRVALGFPAQRLAAPSSGGQ